MPSWTASAPYPSMTKEWDLERLSPTEAQAPAVRLQKEILEEALARKASDIHFEPLEKTVRIRYRVDGCLTGGRIYSRDSLETLVSRFKISCRLDISEKRIPQDGSFRIRYQGRNVDLRVSFLPTFRGEKMVVRLLHPSETFLGMDRLGLPDPVLERLTAMIERPQGLILVVGPTGSGKTTTLYSILKAVAREGINIVTLEDPVEYALEGINQVQINEKIGLTFACTLRAVLRQDPDVILVGEIRDEETAHMALRAAFTGHLVLSTLHTNDAVSTVTRLYNLGLEPYLLSSSLLGILSQRLIRVNCPMCSRPYTPDPRLLERYHLRPPKGAVFRKGQGCPGCGGQGFEGREGLFELLTITPALREAILSRTPETAMRQLAVREGMETLTVAAMNKAVAGRVCLEEMIRVVPYDVGARFCSDCLHPLEHFYRYCPECGKPLGRLCPGCSTDLLEHWKVCPECGATVREGEKENKKNLGKT
jgi:type II secretory ATPase GspE/PulE/Tfp pilus assembly ATPase PilB-like protein